MRARAPHTRAAAATASAALLLDPFPAQVTNLPATATVRPCKSIRPVYAIDPPPPVDAAHHVVPRPRREHQRRAGRRRARRRRQEGQDLRRGQGLADEGRRGARRGAEAQGVGRGRRRREAGRARGRARQGGGPGPASSTFAPRHRALRWPSGRPVHTHRPPRSPPSPRKPPSPPRSRKEAVVEKETEPRSPPSPKAAEPAAGAVKEAEPAKAEEAGASTRPAPKTAPAPPPGWRPPPREPEVPSENTLNYNPRPRHRSTSAPPAARPPSYVTSRRLDERHVRRSSPTGGHLRCRPARPASAVAVDRLRAP